MLAAAHPFEDVVSLLAGHGAFGHRNLQPLACVAGPNVAQHLLGGGGIGSQAFGFLGGEPARRHHLAGLLDHPSETRRVRRRRLMFHSPHFIETVCLCQYATYPLLSSRTLGDVPKLWTETIETHRSQVRDAILENTAALVAEHGLRAVTMSQIAEDSGIGRATLYKYFPDVESILHSWHDRQVDAHLDHLAGLRRRPGTPYERLHAVLEAYAGICYDIAHQNHGAEMTALLHRTEHIAGAERHLSEFVRDMIIEAATSGEIRADVGAGELATYCLNALAAASTMPSRAAVRRLVAVTMTGLGPPQ